jgi:hypothetical protein
LDDRQAFFRVISDYTARYEVVFDATWSQTTHPQDWPNPGHWSGLVGAVHNDQVSFFRVGETASEGIRLMAERGQQDTLLSEIAPAIEAGTAHFQLRRRRYQPRSVQASRPDSQFLRHQCDATLPLVTLCLHGCARVPNLVRWAYLGLV